MLKNHALGEEQLTTHLQCTVARKNSFDSSFGSC